MNEILLHKNSTGVEIVRIDMKKRSKVFKLRTPKIKVFKFNCV